MPEPQAIRSPAVVLDPVFEERLLLLDLVNVTAASVDSVSGRLSEILRGEGGRRTLEPAHEGPELDD